MRFVHAFLYCKCMMMLLLVMCVPYAVRYRAWSFWIHVSLMLSRIVLTQQQTHSNRPLTDELYIVLAGLLHVTTLHITICDIINMPI